MVNFRIPERSLVTVSPEKRLPANVLKFVFNWQLLVGQFRSMGSVVSMLLLDKVGVDADADNDRNAHPDGNVFPQVGSVSSVGSSVMKMFDIFLRLLRVRLREIVPLLLHQSRLTVSSSVSPSDRLSDSRNDLFSSQHDDEVKKWSDTRNKRFLSVIGWGASSG